MVFRVFRKKKEGKAGAVVTPALSECTAVSGFSLVRLPAHSELVSSSAPDCSFRVRSPKGSQSNISVCFDPRLLKLIDDQRQTRLRVTSRFWVLCAQTHLSAYLQGLNDCPPSAQITIDELSEDEMLLATHWRD